MVSVEKRIAHIAFGIPGPDLLNVRVFIEIPPHLIPQPSQLSPLQGLQSLSLDFTEDTLDNNYVSTQEMLRDVRDWTAALDFNIDIPADLGDLSTLANRRKGESRPVLSLKNQSHNFRRRHHWHPHQRLRRHPRQYLPQQRRHQK